MAVATATMTTTMMGGFCVVSNEQEKQKKKLNASSIWEDITNTLSLYVYVYVRSIFFPLFPSHWKHITHISVKWVRTAHKQKITIHLFSKSKSFRREQESEMRKKCK